MIAPSPAPERRRALRVALASGALLRFPGAFAPIVAKLVERQGFDGVYVSGAALAADLGLPDIGLVTQSEGRGPRPSHRARVCAARHRRCRHRLRRPAQRRPHHSPAGGGRARRLPSGRPGEPEALRPSRAQDPGADGRDGAPRARRRARPSATRTFLLIARTDARGPEGLEKAIDRAKAYVDAGAAMIFPEALQDEREFEAFRAAIDVPLMANMTEFGKSPLLSRKHAGGPRLQPGDLPGHHLPPRHEGRGGRAPRPRRERRSAEPRTAHDD